jgi:hypothetical protein
MGAFRDYRVNPYLVLAGSAISKYRPSTAEGQSAGLADPAHGSPQIGKRANSCFDISTPEMATARIAASRHAR